MPTNTTQNSPASAPRSRARWAISVARRSCGRPPQENSGSFWPRTRLFIRSMVEIAGLDEVARQGARGRVDRQAVDAHRVRRRPPAGRRRAAGRRCRTRGPACPGPTPNMQRLGCRCACACRRGRARWWTPAPRSPCCRRPARRRARPVPSRPRRSPRRPSFRPRRPRAARTAAVPRCGARRRTVSRQLHGRPPLFQLGEGVVDLGAAPSACRRSGRPRRIPRRAAAACAVSAARRSCPA